MNESRNVNESRDTHLSLLNGLRNSQHESHFEYSWERFNAKYTPRIYAWARKMGLSQADAEEVCQDMMLSLLKRLKTLSYNPDQSFRGWLRTVTRNAVIDFINARSRMRPTSDESLRVLLDQKPLETEMDRLFDEELLASAKERAEQRLQQSEAGSRNWKIFLQLETHGESADQIAEEFGIRRHAVYVARNRVMDVLREEVEKLNSSGPAS